MASVLLLFVLVMSFIISYLGKMVDEHDRIEREQITGKESGLKGE